MKKWQGKSRGTLLGYRIFIFTIKFLGVRMAYFVLLFVATYYFLFLIKNNRVTFYYFHQRLGYSKLKAIFSIWKNYYTFGQILIDKMAILLGMENNFSFEFDGIEILKQMLAEKKGGILISAHIGNFETAPHFFSKIDVDFQINIVTTDREHSKIKDYLASVSSEKSKAKFIIVKDDLSHIFEINKSLENNELICFTGDRFFEGTKSFRANFLGKEAQFPMGPFLIASRLKAPVAFVYVMKERRLHYHLYARRANVMKHNPQELLLSYTQNLEQMVGLYPLQWFNYFEFWEQGNSEN